MKMTMPCRMPVVMKVRWYPVSAISLVMIGMNRAVPPPNPAAMMPDARPRRSLNHFNAEPIEPLYTNAAPVPARQYST